jgi:hypothetical protein
MRAKHAPVQGTWELSASEGTTGRAAGAWGVGFYMDVDIIARELRYPLLPIRCFHLIGGTGLHVLLPFRVTSMR